MRSRNYLCGQIKKKISTLILKILVPRTTRSKLNHTKYWLIKVLIQWKLRETDKLRIWVRILHSGQQPFKKKPAFLYLPLTLLNLWRLDYGFDCKCYIFEIYKIQVTNMMIIILKCNQKEYIQVWNNITAKKSTLIGYVYLYHKF